MGIAEPVSWRRTAALSGILQCNKKGSQGFVEAEVAKERGRLIAQVFQARDSTIFRLDQDLSCMLQGSFLGQPLSSKPVI